MAIRIAEIQEREVQAPPPRRVISPPRVTLDTPATAPGQAPAMRASDLLITALCLQRMGLQSLADELQGLMALPRHEPTVEVAAATLIRDLTAQVLGLHRHVLRAQAGMPASTSTATAAQVTRQDNAFDEELRAALAALDECRWRRRARASRSHPTAERQRTGNRATRQSAGCCEDLDEAVRTTTWLLARLVAKPSCPETIAGGRGCDPRDRSATRVC